MLRLVLSLAEGLSKHDLFEIVALREPQGERRSVVALSLSKCDNARKGCRMRVKSLINLLVVPMIAWSQNSAVPWSAFSGGFGVATSTSTAVLASTGEIVGASEGGNTSVKSGFLVVKLQQGPPSAIDAADGLPTTYALRQNYPNPFNPQTTIRFSLPVATNTRIIVYDLSGKEIVRLVDRRLEAGYHQLVWNGRDRRGRELPTGMYIVLMATPEFTKSIKLVLIK